MFFFISWSEKSPHHSVKWFCSTIDTGSIPSTWSSKRNSVLPVLLLRALGSKMLELKPQRLGAKVLEPHEFLGCELGTKSGWADGCFFLALHFFFKIKTRFCSLRYLRNFTSNPKKWPRWTFSCSVCFRSCFGVPDCRAYSQDDLMPRNAQAGGKRHLKSKGSSVCAMM